MPTLKERVKQWEANRCRTHQLKRTHAGQCGARKQSQVRKETGRDREEDQSSHNLTMHAGGMTVTCQGWRVGARGGRAECISQFCL